MRIHSVVLTCEIVTWVFIVLLLHVSNRSEAGALAVYQYDSLNRLTNVLYSGGAFQRYSYDNAGNRLRHESHNPLSISAVANQITDAGIGTAAVPVIVASEVTPANALGR